jgi:ABC-type nitrate/sulfonate/bicarbonate transport system substrate-binding protein
MHKILWYGAGALIIILLAGFMFYGKFTAESSKAPQTLASIKIGVYPSSPNAYYPLFVAQKEGYFADEGLSVELVPINPGLSVAALLAHQLDYAQYLKEVAAAALKGAEVKIVSIYPQEPAYALVSQPDMALKDIKKIGVNFPQDGNHYQALQAIHDDGLSATVSTSNAEALLASKQVDAVVLNLADSYGLEARGYKLQQILKSDTVSGFTARSETIEQDPAQVAAVIRARERAFAFIAANPDEAKTLLFEALGLEKDDANQQEVDSIYTAISQRPSATLPPDSSINILIKLAKAGTFTTYDDIDKQEISPDDIPKVFDLSAMPAHAN